MAKVTHAQNACLPLTLSQLQATQWDADVPMEQSSLAVVILTSVHAHKLIKPMTKLLAPVSAIAALITASAATTVSVFSV